jgi:hypothetical protein
MTASKPNAERTHNKVLEALTGFMGIKIFGSSLFSSTLIQFLTFCSPMLVVQLGHSFMAFQT